jgi:glutathione synthase/RimK-type ligase-like ATP-grasp enzyme
MPFLLYSQNTSKTGRRLGRLLQIPHGRTPPDEAQDVLIRWGSSTRVAHRPQRVLNTKKGIEQVTDKLKALEQLRVHHVPTPRVTRLTTHGSLEMMNFPVLARRIHHQEGRDIVLCMQVADVQQAQRNGSEYVVEYIPTRTEYRMHVFNQEIIRSSQKVINLNANPEVFKPWIRNHNSGFVFVNPREQPSPSTKMAAIDAVQNTALTFGAVDVIVGDNGRPYVLEINTGPGLVESGLRTYAEKFAELLQIDTLNETVLTEINDEVPNQTEVDHEEEEE